MLGNPKVGFSWESLVLFELKSILTENIYFWNTHAEAELDFFLTHKGKNIGIECKFADAPKLTSSMKISMKDLGLHKIYVVYPGDKEYQLDKNILAIPISSLEKIF